MDADLNNHLNLTINLSSPGETGTLHIEANKNHDTDVAFIVTHGDESAPSTLTLDEFLGMVNVLSAYAATLKAGT